MAEKVPTPADVFGGRSRAAVLDAPKHEEGNSLQSLKLQDDIEVSLPEDILFEEPSLDSAESGPLGKKEILQEISNLKAEQEILSAKIDQRIAELEAELAFQDSETDETAPEQVINDVIEDKPGIQPDVDPEIEATIEPEVEPKVEDRHPGEMSWEEYLASRPKTGVYHKNGRFHHAEGGKFASEATYNAQFEETAQEHYDNVGEINEQIEVESPNYEAMSIAELTREAGKAKVLGDKAAFDEIRAIAKRVFEERSAESNASKGDDSDANLESFEESSENYNNRVRAEEQARIEENNAKIYIEKQNIIEKFKKAFSREVGYIHEYGGQAWWKGVWERSKLGLTDKFLEKGVAELETEEEKEEQRRVNRRNVTIGAIAAGVGIGFVAGHLTGNYIAEQLSGAELTAALPVDTAGSEYLSEAPHPAALDYVPPVDSSAAIEAPAAFDAQPDAAPTPEAPPSIEYTINNTAYDIPRGSGGYQLFNSLGLSDEAWRSNADTLADRFPRDFYREGSDVRIAHSGWLSQEARTFIETLRR